MKIIIKFYFNSLKYKPNNNKSENKHNNILNSNLFKLFIHLLPGFFPTLLKYHSKFYRKIPN